MATKWCVQRKESEGLGYFGDKRKMGESGYSREKRLVIGQMRMMERERETERGLMGGNMNVIENQNWENLSGLRLASCPNETGALNGVT